MAVFTRENLHLPAADAGPLLPAGARASALLWQGAAAGAGLVLGAGQVYGGAAPFGLALVIGCPPGYLFAAGAGALAAGLVFQPLAMGLRLAGALAAAVAGRWLGGGRPRTGALAGCLTLLAVQALELFFAGGVPDPAGLAATGCTALLAAGFGWAFVQFPPQQARGACLLLAVGVACLQRFAAGPWAPGLALAAAAGLCAAIAGTLEQTAVLSIAFAAALTAASPGLCHAALAVALGSLAASCLYPGERWRCAGVFTAGCTLGALAAPDAAGVLPLAAGAGLGACVALALPGEWLAGGVPGAGTPGPGPGPRRGRAAAFRRGRYPQRHRRDRQRRLRPPDAAPGREFRLCGGARGPHHLQDLHPPQPLLGAGLRHGHGRALPAQTRPRKPGPGGGGGPAGQLSVCIHPGDLCMAANHGYRLWRSRRQTRARAATLRAALTEQYSALASALAQLAGKLGQAGLPDPRREAKVAQLFAGLGLEALECSVTADLAGRLTVSVTIARTRFTAEEAAALGAEVSRLCRRDLEEPEITHCRTVTMLTFSEKPLFRAQFGAAAHAARGQAVSGDALEQFCDASGRAQMLLCDGMGTGRAAAVDGQMAARLTSQLLRAGFAAESAARLVNVALGLKNAEQESGATLDLLTVDLYTGRAGLFKAGAAPSFLVRGGVPHPLEGASLPMGVLDTVVGRSTTFGLDAGDWVVLVSDGVLADGSEWLLQQLQLCAKLDHTPEQAARAIADAAVRRAGEKQDDITVAVLRLAASKGVGAA